MITINALYEYGFPGYNFKFPMSLWMQISYNIYVC